ncbi:hypothetical protein DFJ73DRAFT_870502 [Zopfochytrium polystomum]|nr:hypothetical protein DFJ73DRAFT_870502 [Zopfochytrium polystomum]
MALPAAADRLESLMRLRELTGSLKELQHNLIGLHVERDKIGHSLDELASEKRLLLKEKDTLLKLLAGVQADMNEIATAEGKLEAAREEANAKINELKGGEYESIRGKVDGLRREHGLSPTRPLQELLDRETSRLLDERRAARREAEFEAEGLTGSSPAPAAAAAAAVAPGGPSAMETAAPSSSSSSRDRTTKKRKR